MGWFCLKSPWLSLEEVGTTCDSGWVNHPHGFASKVGNHTWIGSVQGAVATWDYRYYSFNSKWADGEMMASMRDGCGDEYFILFNSQGAIMKGFAHESAMSPWSNDSEQVWPGVLDQVPNEFGVLDGACVLHYGANIFASGEGAPMRPGKRDRSTILKKRIRMVQRIYYLS